MLFLLRLPVSVGAPGPPGQLPASTALDCVLSCGQLLMRACAVGGRSFPGCAWRAEERARVLATLAFLVLPHCWLRWKLLLTPSSYRVTALGSVAQNPSPTARSGFLSVSLLPIRLVRSLHVPDDQEHVLLTPVSGFDTGVECRCICLRQRLQEHALTGCLFDQVRALRGGQDEEVAQEKKRQSKLSRSYRSVKARCRRMRLCVCTLE